ncbi:hypothetical protein CJF42_07835 [Pseudoalteromonas sp. NBT06-2]|nr:hypothetical protein CJF42_07835 [Pseudoalteromonas sp. NBT06-2]
MVKACTDDSCENVSTESVSLDLLADGVRISSLIFTGSNSLSFNHTDVETLTFSLANISINASDPMVCDDGSSASCDIAFTDAGFRFLYGTGDSTTLPNQTSGSEFGDTLKLQAVKNSNGVCTGLFTSNKNLDLSQQNVEPDLDGNSGLSLSINGNNIAKHPNTTNTILNFGASSIAIIPTPIYHDAGKIRLHANYNVGGVTLSDSSNAFWVSPDKLVVEAKAGATILNAATATATPTHKAAVDFDLTVTALNNLDVITPNYVPKQIQFKLTRTGPINHGEEGVLTDGSSGSIMSELLSTPPTFKNVTLDNTIIPSKFGSSAAQ